MPLAVWISHKVNVFVNTVILLGLGTYPSICWKSSYKFLHFLRIVLITWIITRGRRRGSVRNRFLPVGNDAWTPAGASTTWIITHARPRGKGPPSTEYNTFNNGNSNMRSPPLANEWPPCKIGEDRRRKREALDLRIDWIKTRWRDEARLSELIQQLKMST